MIGGGFVLTRLTLTGPGVPSAEVCFRAGLNVVAGPSDTGKTFIAQCIDFAMGAGSAPKEIPQAASYDSIQLELVAREDNRTFVLQRNLRGGDIRLLPDQGEERILAAKHQADNVNNVSAFLLGLSGLAGTKVLKNQRGETRNLSFRDIAPLIIVDEETVISSISPVLSIQFITRTVEKSVFRFLLTGVDDSSVVAKQDPKVAKGRQEGKTAVLETLLERTRLKIAELNLDGDEASIGEHLVRVETQLENASAELEIEQENVALLEERRRSAWARLRQVESRGDVLSELQKRFELLREQYSSDLRRLEAISEVGVRLGQMKEERCPVCGALAEHHDHEHQKPPATPEEMAGACRAEAEKIRGLLEDLRGTLADNATEVERLSAEQNSMQAALEAAAGELSGFLQPRLQVAVQKMRDSQAQRDIYKRARELYDQANELEELLVEAGAQPKRERAEGLSTNVGAGEAEQFCLEVEELLRSWHFPSLGRVTFSEDDQDIVISGRRRGSHGKGVRAITHAAFNLALLRYCSRLSKPFPRFVLIDSPLVVYREPDTEEGGFPPDVKDAFYRSVAAGFRDAQVIIFENDDPPTDVSAIANVISFTGTIHGRRGFIPHA